MKMQEIYQSLLLIYVLSNNGKASKDEFASAIYEEDSSRTFDYYSEKIHPIPGKVLVSHKILERSGDKYSLIAYEELDQNQIDELIEQCREKLQEFKNKKKSSN